MKITVITACYNAIGTLPDTVASVRSQRLPGGVEVEHLVIDGGSSDGSVEMLAGVGSGGGTVEGYSFKFVSEKDRGLYDAINKGIAMATGEVIGILNADDVFASDDVIARIADAFDPGVDVVYGDIRFVRELGGETVRYCTGKYFRRWMFRFATFPAHPSTFVRRECFAKYGVYSLDYRICSDFEMMLRLLYVHRLPMKYLPLCTTEMRLGGMSTDGVRSNVAINAEDLRALRANGVWSCLPLIYLKYLFKIWGFVFRKGR